jgi:hypothetical protein
MSKVVSLSETTLGPSHHDTIARKQTSNEWLSEANQLTSKGDEYEEDGTSRDVHTRASQEPTESTQHVDSSIATVVTVDYDKSLFEAKK